MGSRRPYSGGKITKKLKEYVNPFDKPKQQQIKKEMLDYYRKSQKSHLFIDNRKEKYNKKKDKFSLEEQKNFENDYSLGQFDEPEVSEPLPEPKLHLERKIKKKLLKEVNNEILNEIDDLFEDAKKDLVFKNKNSKFDLGESDKISIEFDAIRNKFSFAIPPIDVDTTKKPLDSERDKTPVNILDALKSALSTPGNNKLPELLNSCIFEISKKLDKGYEWWDLSCSIAKILRNKKNQNKVYNYFLNCLNILYKSIIGESEDIIKKYHLDNSVELTSNEYLTFLSNNNTTEQIATLFLTIKVFPIKSEEFKLGYLSLQLLERSAEGLLTSQPISNIYIYYLLVLYRIALQNNFFIPVFFLLAKKTIEENNFLAVERVEEIIKNTALIIKHLSIFSKGAYVFSHFWYTKKMDEELKKFKTGPLLVKVINYLRDRWISPPSMLNSQPKAIN